MEYSISSGLVYRFRAEKKDEGIAAGEDANLEEMPDP